VAFAVRVHPGAKRTQAKGVMADPTSPRSTRLRRAGGTIKVDIASAPEDGKANAELIRFLAEEFAVPRSCVEILRGHTAKTKTVCITAVP